MRRFPSVMRPLVATLMCSTQADAGTVNELYRSGCSASPGAGKSVIQSKYRAARVQDDKGVTGIAPRAGRRS
jgi:hypothetical protein